MVIRSWQPRNNHSGVHQSGGWGCQLIRLCRCNNRRLSGKGSGAVYVVRPILELVLGATDYWVGCPRGVPSVWSSVHIDMEVLELEGYCIVE